LPEVGTVDWVGARVDCLEAEDTLTEDTLPVAEAARLEDDGADEGEPATHPLS